MVEYKGGHLADTPDTKEKEIIGQIWATKSKGRCLFKIVGKAEYRGIIQEVVKGK